MKTLTPEILFAFACDHFDTKQKYPTVRQVAIEYRVTQQVVIDTCEDWYGEGYMRPAVGIRCGNGIAGYDRIGDYLIEAYPYK
jgi:hypothetical protein